MKVRRVFTAVALFGGATLYGCSTIMGPQTNFERGNAALSAGNLPLAETHFMAATKEGEPNAWNNLGVVYEQLSRRDEAVRAYTLAARFGMPVAQSNLMRLGAAVPTADLAALVAQPQAQGNTAAELTGAVLQGIAQGYRSPAPPTPPAKPVTCTSLTIGFGQFAKVKTICE